MSLTIRSAQPGEAGLVLGFIRKLADYEERLDEVVASEAEIELRVEDVTRLLEPMLRAPPERTDA